MLSKRREIWWTRFTSHGERFQRSLETSNKQEAMVRERKMIAEAEAGHLSAVATDFSRLTFGDAIKQHLTDRKKDVSLKTGKILAANTRKTEAERAVPLTAHLGSFPVRKFTSTLVTNYVNRRLETVANATVCRELDLIRAILRKANVWSRIADRVPRVRPSNEQVGRAFSAEELARIEAAAKTRPGWRNCRLAFTLCVNTSMRPAELRSLQWQDIDFVEKTLTLRDSKTPKGRRTIPLNDAAFEAVQELRRDAMILAGGFSPADWFVLPGEDPTAPVGSWRKAWKSLLEKACVPYTRFYDSRHTAVTKFLSNPEASEQAVKSVVGHVSQQMLDRYSHIRIEAKRRAVGISDTRSGTKLVQFEGSGTPSDR
jgi:integrase